MNKNAMLLAGTPENFGFMIEVMANGAMRTNFHVKQIYSCALNSRNGYSFYDLAIGILERATPISQYAKHYKGEACSLIVYPKVFVSEFTEHQFRVLAKEIMDMIGSGTVTLSSEWISEWVAERSHKKHSLDLGDLLV